MTTYLLPGMGATSAMYQGPWRNLDDLIFLDWPSYQGEQTLKDVAKRIIDEHSITESDCVGGSSMGGMVALEIAAICNCARVYLIGSAMCLEEINPLIRLLGPITKITPWRFTQIIAGSSSGMLGDMYKQTDAAFLKTMCEAIKTWNGVDYPEEHIKRVHGEKDPVITAVQHAQFILDAGHVIAMSHAHTCIDLLQIDNV